VTKNHLKSYRLLVPNVKDVPSQIVFIACELFGLSYSLYSFLVKNNELPFV